MAMQPGYEAVVGSTIPGYARYMNERIGFRPPNAAALIDLTKRGVEISW
jgi:hypothetical protein